MLIAAALLALLSAIAGALYIYAELQVVAPIWRRLPARPGLPPDMEYQCWSVMTDFDSNLLSDAVVHAVGLLSPIYGRGVVYAALRGARLLVYREGTYPGGECGPPVAGVVMAPRWAPVEMRLRGVAHAIAHLVERHAGVADYAHAGWVRRGVEAAVFAYEERWSRLWP